MKLVTLRRQAPVAPDAVQCQLCDAAIQGKLQDHLLVGQPGTAQPTAICPSCGQVLSRLVDLIGPELHFLVQAPQSSVKEPVGGPAGRTAVTRAPADRLDLDSATGPDIERTRQQLTTEANKLAATERALREAAERLGDALPEAREPGPHR
ncbi:MAG: hypothetical protein ACR2IK_07935 [Chloroflexota bacterium]